MGVLVQNNHTYLLGGTIFGIQVPSDIDSLLPILELKICMQVIGHNLLAHCQGKLNVNLSSVICLSQPAIASIYSFVIFNETITLMEIFGIAIVIAGVFMVQAQYTPKESISVA